MSSPTPPNEHSELYAQIYEEIRAIARRSMAGERRSHTLQPTALAHEAFLALSRLREAGALEPTHVVALASRAIRRILVNHATARLARRRGDGARQQELDDELHGELSAPNGADPLELVALNEALEELERVDARQAQLVELRFFGGLSHEEIARIQGVSARTVDADWALARAWLRRRIDGAKDPR
jgi:RNA polymerase sigma factor (TIGR02999 family)